MVVDERGPRRLGLSSYLKVAQTDLAVNSFMEADLSEQV